MEKVKWKKIPIEGFEHYKVSNTGIVVNRNTKNIKKPYKRGAYMGIKLCNQGTLETFSVHRLVALAFILNANLEQKQVNHKDGNHYNNHSSNLEWVTAKEDTKHAL